MPDPDSALYALLLHDHLRRATERAGAILSTENQGYRESDKEVSCTSRKMAARDGALLHRHRPNPSQRKNQGLTLKGTLLLVAS